jgi:hypothetical protein
LGLPPAGMGRSRGEGTGDLPVHGHVNDVITNYRNLSTGKIFFSYSCHIYIQRVVQTENSDS